MGIVELAKGIYWVGAIDWNIRNFHGYTTPHGTTYNAYLVVDEKVALIDTVKAPFAKEMLDNIAEVIDLKKIDYMISNHVEMDHSGAIPVVMEKLEGATVVSTVKGQEGLTRTYKAAWPFSPIKEGDELNLGQRAMKFIEAPMLHWPDNMLVFLEEEGILFSNDAFGQHIASSFRYDDQVPFIMPEAAKYYANIVMPFGSMVRKALEKLKGANVKMIAPSHGQIWRRDPGKIIQAYSEWSHGVVQEKVLIVYDTMWGSTESMAQAILKGVVREGVEIKLFHLSKTDWSEIIKEVLDAKVLLIGSPTLNRGMFPTVAGFLAYLKGLRPKGKLGLAFGSYGWSAGAVKAAKQELKDAGVKMMDTDLEITYVPDEDDLLTCTHLGQEIARQVKRGS